MSNYNGGGSGMTNFPNGLTSFGIPLLGSKPTNFPNLSGNVWFLDHANGSDGNDGKSPATAFKTFTHTLTKVGSGTGDTVFVFPGTYAENVVITGINNVAFIAAFILSILDAGNARPVINPTTGIPLTLAECNGLYFYGIKFLTTAASTGAVTTDSIGTVFENCHFSGTTAGITFTSAVSASYYGQGTVFNGCWFTGNVNGIKCTDFSAPGTTNATNGVVQNCLFSNNSGADITDDSSAAVFWSYWTISGNIFADKTKTAYLQMNGNGSQTTTHCAISGNYFGATGTMTTTMIALEAGSMFMGNFSTIGVVDGHTF